MKDDLGYKIFMTLFAAICLAWFAALAVGMWKIVIAQ